VTEYLKPLIIGILAVIIGSKLANRLPF